jgi:hypothetical protein
MGVTVGAKPEDQCPEPVRPSYLGFLAFGMATPQTRLKEEAVQTCVSKMKRRDETPVKLTREQLDRIERCSGFCLKTGFRIRMGITYYFVLSVSGNICVYEHNEKMQYEMVNAFLTTSCKPKFFNLVIPYMLKHGWLED